MKSSYPQLTSQHIAVIQSVISMPDAYHIMHTGIGKQRRARERERKKGKKIINNINMQQCMRKNDNS